MDAIRRNVNHFTSMTLTLTPKREIESLSFERDIILLFGLISWYYCSNTIFSSARIRVLAESQRPAVTGDEEG
jgi:hypothetical protein